MHGEAASAVESAISCRPGGFKSKRGRHPFAAWQRQTKVWQTNDKSRTGRKATKKREANLGPLMCPTKPTTKIRFTEPQIALVMRAYPNCNLFEFDQAGKIIVCSGRIKQGGKIDHDYAGSGLAHLYRAARRRLTAGPPSATILQFPSGAIK